MRSKRVKEGLIENIQSLLMSQIREEVATTKDVMADCLITDPVSLMYLFWLLKVIRKSLKWKTLLVNVVS